MCDKPVPVSGCSAICGYPTEPGDYDLSDYVLLPKELMGIHPEMFVPVEGESMLDADYEPGDQLRIRFGVTPHDNEDVLAWIDGRCTVKTLFTDEDGQKWLVPRNEEYDAILLTEENDFLNFCDRVKRLLPDHEHLPDHKDLMRINVLSFTKPLSMWVESNAPVKGQRFRDYLRIGMTMSGLLAS